MAAVCIYNDLVRVAVEALKGSGIYVAAVATAFPVSVALEGRDWAGIATEAGPPQTGTLSHRPVPVCHLPGLSIIPTLRRCVVGRRIHPQESNLRMPGAKHPSMW